MTEITSGPLSVMAALIFVLVLAMLGMYIGRRRRVAGLLGDAAIIRQLMGLDLARAPLVRLGLVTAATAALAFALLDPSLATPPAAARGPVVLLLDASASMLVDDLGETRIEAQRRIARSLVRELDGVPIGVVAFAGRAFSLTPPTRDLTSIEMYLTTIDPSIVTQSGSAFGAAIRQGVGLLAAGGTTSGGSIVMIGDGDETDDPGAALEAATLARRSGLRVHTVSVGSAAGGPVPAVDAVTGSMAGYLLDTAGQPIVSRMDEELLRSVSERTGGVHVAAQDADAVVALRDAIVGPATEPAPRQGGLPRYTWLATAALLLLLVEPVGERLGGAP